MHLDDLWNKYQELVADQGASIESLCRELVCLLAEKDKRCRPLFFALYALLLERQGLEQSLHFSALIKKAKGKELASQLSSLHHGKALQAESDGNLAKAEFHLYKALQLSITAEVSSMLARLLAEKDDFTGALQALQCYQGPFNCEHFYQKLYILNKTCHFKAIKKAIPKIKKLIAEGDSKGSILFFNWIGLDSKLIFQAARNYQRSLEGQQDLVLPEKKCAGQRLRLGYIGSNFVDHPQSCQFGRSFFKRQRLDFEVYIYSMRGNGESPTEKNIKEQVDCYYDIGPYDVDLAVALMRSHQLDIVINCNGFADHFSGIYAILSHRVAPVQIDFLGYPGSSGATYIDYYIGDPVSTPPASYQKYFTEKLLLMPYTYQLTEHLDEYPQLGNEKPSLSALCSELKQLIRQNWDIYGATVLQYMSKELFSSVSELYRTWHGSSTVPIEEKITWLKKKWEQREGFSETSLKQCMTASDDLLKTLTGDAIALEAVLDAYVSRLLPPEDFVKSRFLFCSLNHQVKLSIRDIRCWNAILKAVPNSILCCLLMFAPEAKGHILQAFDPEIRNRIYFIGWAPKLIHLHRLRGLDCLLDACHYGAHTTAGDALWMGVPIVTVLGANVAGRVCASMLMAAGMGELVAQNQDSYMAIAKRCASDSAFYNRLLVKLKDARGSPLFDRALYTEELSNLYRTAWAGIHDEFFQNPDGV